MPTLWKRLDELFTARSHAVIDQLEDPAQMSQQLLRELDQDIDALRGQLVASLARQRKLQQSLGRLNRQVDAHGQRASKALQAGDEVTARHQLTLKLKLQQESSALQELSAQQERWSTGLREERSVLLREREELSSQARLIQLRSDLNDGINAPMKDAYSASLQRRERMGRYSAQTESGLDELLAAQSLRREELDVQPQQDDSQVEEALAQLKSELSQDTAA